MNNYLLLGLIFVCGVVLTSLGIQSLSNGGFIWAVGVIFYMFGNMLIVFSVACPISIWLLKMLDSRELDMKIKEGKDGSGQRS